MKSKGFYFFEPSTINSTPSIFFHIFIHYIGCHILQIVDLQFLSHIFFSYSERISKLIFSLPIFLSLNYFEH